jgi:predicted SnoaL-like aldol condensation-catalyzing enzyme
MTAQERNKQQFQRLYDEVINTGDLERADVYITPDRPDNDPGLPPEMTRTGRASSFLSYVSSRLPRSEIRY